MYMYIWKIYVVIILMFVAIIDHKNENFQIYSLLYMLTEWCHMYSIG